MLVLVIVLLIVIAVGRCGEQGGWAFEHEQEHEG